MIDKEDLRRLAQAASPGPWEVVKDHHFPGVHGGDVILGGSFCDYSEPTREDEEFIAAANPAVVLELLDEIERLRTQRDEHKADWLEALALAEQASPILARQQAEIERLRADAARYQFIRAGGAYVEPSDNSLYVALDERGKYYDDRRDLDMDIDEAIATQRGE